MYILFFFPDSGSAGDFFSSSPLPPFSALEELFQIFAYYIPATSIVLYFCYKDTACFSMEQSIALPANQAVLSRIKSAFSVLLSAIALIFIGGVTILLEYFFTKIPVSDNFAPVKAPSGLFSVSVMAASCIIAAYLEEGFFRLLLCGRLTASGLKKSISMFISSLLFAVCHTWEGIWGVTGAFFSGLFLSFVFENKKSLHHVALCHALYNIFVYLLP
jgi:membrane protease YdiL (CAAX protease family)